MFYKGYVTRGMLQEVTKVILQEVSYKLCVTRGMLQDVYYEEYGLSRLQEVSKKFV